MEENRKLELSFDLEIMMNLREDEKTITIVLKLLFSAWKKIDSSISRLTALEF